MVLSYVITQRVEYRSVLYISEESSENRKIMWALLSKANGEVNISHETTTMVVWIYDGM